MPSNHLILYQPLFLLPSTFPSNRVFSNESTLHIFSIQFSRSVMSDSLWAYELQHTRPPCPSPTSAVHPNPCPSSRWCHLTISSSVIPFSSRLQSFPASSPITSWQIDGEQMETVRDSIFLSSKITVDGDCIHKRHLLLWRKAMTNLDSVLKSRDITLLTKVHLVKAMVFLIVIHECESWTIKNAECQKNWCFQSVVLEGKLWPT